MATDDDKQDQAMDKPVDKWQQRLAAFSRINEVLAAFDLDACDRRRVVAALATLYGVPHG